MFNFSRFIHALLGLFLVMGLYTCAVAQTEATLFRAEMSGLSAIPPNDSPATGFATIHFEDGVAFLAYHVEFQDLVGTETAAYMWNSFTGDRLLDLELGTPKHGSVEHGNVFGPWINPLLNGVVWITIETDVYPDGEISGQFTLFGVVGVEHSSWGAIKSLYR